MGKVITHRFVELVQPRAARTEYPDAGCPGLYLIVQPSGTRNGRSASATTAHSGKRTFRQRRRGWALARRCARRAAAHRHRLEQGTP